MRLRDAMLCIDCEEVFELQGHRSDGRDMEACPACGSAVTRMVSSWIQTMNHFYMEEAKT